MQPNTVKWVWPIVCGALALLLAPAFWVAFHSTTELSSAGLAALSHPVDVAIAFCAGYLGLDRFRYHRRIAEMVAHAGVSDLKKWLVTRFETNTTENGHELSYLLLLRLAGDHEVCDAVKGREEELRETELYSGGDGRALRWLLEKRYDRKVIMLLLAALCLWQILAAVTELECFGKWAFRSGVEWVVLELIVVSWIAILISWWLGEQSLGNVESKTRNWRKWMAISMARGAGDITATQTKAPE